MKSQRIIIPVVLLTIFLVTGANILAALRNSSMSGITLEFPDTITAGDAWTLRIHVPAGQAGEPVNIQMYHGLRRLDAELMLGSGGVAAWEVAAGALTQSGMSLIVVRYQETEARASLTVMPSVFTRADFFATLNTIAAYGDEATTLLLLPRDDWGNSVAAGGFSVSIRYPDGVTKRLPMSGIHGIAWAELTSGGSPGRIRVSLNELRLGTPLEIQQVAGAAHNITLQLASDCVLADGRDMIMLTAQVQDRHGVPVVDGTLVRFLWDGGAGSAITTDGNARIRLPAPTVHGEYRFWAVSDAAHSPEVRLRVVNESCQ
ncbi:MAG: hypothetical protein SF123_24510 [Chloroflexota bacterium]|nr:hypothetical protein [Chloroflexota bacterium]